MTARPLSVLDILTAEDWNAKEGDNKILFRKKGTGEVSYYHSTVVTFLFSHISSYGTVPSQLVPSQPNSPGER